MVCIQIKGLDGAFFRTRDFDEVFAPNHVRPDFFQLAGKGDIALYAVCADPGNADGRGGNQTGCEKVGCAGGIAFDVQMFGCVVAGISGDFEDAVVFVGNLYAELRHQFQCNVDIGLGNQFADHTDFKCLSGQRQRHQEGGQKLAGHIDFNRNHAIAAVLALADMKRRIVFVAEIFDIGAGNPQRIDQVADGAFVHTRHAMQMIIAAQNGKRGSQRAESRACVA